MISYDPFWILLEKSKESQYTLIRNYGLSSSTISRLKHNKSVCSDTINKLCFILNCQPGDLMQYTPEPLENITKIFKLSYEKFQEIQIKCNETCESDLKENK